ncbi:MULTISPECIES: CapA family protein [unclassified Breznakia]|uniref:CapA family protein n=1 Tax=unclassified Breznakia TaxID=2623764 RepID=UPI0024741C47|nr:MULTISPECIES: CapA family protein [unclassified Breznakia]MDH6367819.1 poly-gamma-glutamate capsule biosynthesis protein CapA/YwtB (metallophosphatase superfamily) [Breznakia sp. PH1-1]MDH6404884.1 poly-gamma-glutamate capsule biosynthesis protein CapA/YwtB (metallophosphatase superfamily) [Breznakia sp. PF1-11]MDH6412622.1 poly-gamma-glutamate capsule biosynthesis protein CapA/YwtB (metallophosphatase superfamily) [Breznakia sp. PFB1-11]MDH6414959.1 poly-gamma-glutamate capsule biosynthesis
MKKLVVIVIMCMLVACGSNPSETKKDDTSKDTNKPVEEGKVVDISVSAVGDNLIHEAVYYYAKKADGSYGFDEMYEPMLPYIQKDISYINQETLAAGDELGLSHYPQFNGPYEILDDVKGAGFNWINTASNHSYDRGEQGVINQYNYLKQLDLMQTGMQVDANESRIRYREIKGVKVAFLSYTYGLNGFELPEGKSYLINLIDKEIIAKDMKEANANSDIQMVSMHWGEEYHFEPNDEQKELAQFLSDAGADVIIGGHPHVIQTGDILTGKNGNTTLTYYSLGNFLSAQDGNDNMLGGLASFTMSYDTKTKEVTFKDVKFIPTITQITNAFHNYKVYTLKDYTDEMASVHTLTQKGLDMKRQYFIDLLNQVMNDKIEVVY